MFSTFGRARLLQQFDLWTSNRYAEEVQEKEYKIRILEFVRFFFFICMILDGIRTIFLLNRKRVLYHERKEKMELGTDEFRRLLTRQVLWFFHLMISRMNPVSLQSCFGWQLISTVNYAHYREFGPLKTVMGGCNCTDGPLQSKKQTAEELDSSRKLQP